MGILAAFAVPHPPLLIPGVGDGSKRFVKKTKEAYEEVARRSAELKPETLVVFSPHAPSYAEAFYLSPGVGARGDFSSFRANEAVYSTLYDEEFVSVLEELLAEKGIPGTTQGQKDTSLDHATMVPLHFFSQAADEGSDAGAAFKIVRIGLSQLSDELHFELGRAVAKAAELLDRKVVVIASGDLSHKLMSSGPYGFVPEGRKLDEKICAALAEGSTLSLMAIDKNLAEDGAECGLRSFIMMGGALDGLSFEPELLSYEGPLGVGYAVASFLVGEEAAEAVADGAAVAAGAAAGAAVGAAVVAGVAMGAEASDEASDDAAAAAVDEAADEAADDDAAADDAAAEGDAADDEASSEKAVSLPDTSLPVSLARVALQSFFDLGFKRPTLETPEVQELLELYQQDEEFSEQYEDLASRQAGVFVSIHDGKELRGCIGTIASARESVLAEIIQNAVSAAREDPRFLPVLPSELEELTVKVDILGEAEPVVDRETLDAQRFGVIVRRGHRRGLLLPSLDGVDTPEQQIKIALSKAGIRSKETYTLERFEVVRYT